MEYRLDSIKATLVDDYLHFDEGYLPKKESKVVTI